MVDKPDMNPKVPPQTAGTPPPQTQPKTEFKAPEDSGTGWAKPMKWMGMEFNSQQVKQLWNIISQSVSKQIQKDQDKAVKALKKLRSDDPDSDDS